MKRILSAAVFLPVFWLVVKRGPPALYHGLIVIAAILALFELFRLAEARGLRCHRPLAVLVALLLLGSVLAPPLRPEYALLAGLFLLPAASLRRGGDWGRALGDIGASFFIAVFTGALFGYLALLRIVADPAQGSEVGADLVFLLFLVVWGGDMTAYYVGSFLGRRPLAPA